MNGYYPIILFNHNNLLMSVFEKRDLTYLTEYFFT